jgi:hypothetical protein
MEQVASLVPTFVSILIGSTIFALVSVLCGYSPFYDLNFPKALALCGTVGVFAFLLSDMPQAMISMGKSHPEGGWPLAEQALEHITTFSSYKRLVVNGFALAFIMSGLIGSDLLLNLRKFFSGKTAARLPISEWDAMLWLYGKTGDEVAIHLRRSSRVITGSLDFRSIASNEPAIVLKKPRSNGGDLGDYVYIDGSEISTIALKKTTPYAFKTFVTELFCKNWHHLALFTVGLVIFTIQVTQPEILALNTALILEILTLAGFMLYLFLV